MRTFLFRTSAVVTAALGALAVSMVGMSSASAGTPGADQVETRLAALDASGTTVEYRRARPGEPMTEGVRVSLTADDAARPRTRCGPGWVCLYSDAGGAGLKLQLAGGFSYPNFENVCTQGVCYDFNDKMSSWENGDSEYHAWHPDKNYGGGCRDMAPHGAGRVINVSRAFNDQASSIGPGRCV